MKTVRFVGTNGSPAEEYVRALADDETAIIDTLPPDPNVTVKFRLDTVRPVKVMPNKKARDLLDLAVCIYIADETEERAVAVDHWSRSFEFVVPVDDPAAWQAATPELQKALRTLSSDHCDFTWVQRQALPVLGRHRKLLPSGYDTVCLFSGGIDSLLGAYQLLKEGRRVLLVGHQADVFTAATQKDLFLGLHNKFGNQVRFVQCRVARTLSSTPHYRLPDKVEITHRSRSFLFLSLAITVAGAVGIGEVVLPENGLIALNPPLQASRIGTLSTRTAHPIYLTRLLDFLSTAGIFTGSIRNPFLYQSKTDMLKNLDPELHPLVLRSISCSNVGRLVGKTGKLHCGHCVPCIYRRAALVHAGIDNPDNYADDLFQNLSSVTKHCQIDFRALVGFAGRIIATSAVARDLMVFSHGAFAPDIGGRIGPYAARNVSPWSNMLLRWAQNFMQTVEALSSASTRCILGLP